MEIFTINTFGKCVRRLATVVLLVSLSPLASDAAIPAGYYRSLNGLKDANLKTAVHNLVRNFTLISSYQALPQYFQYTDVYPDSNRWWDMYSNIPFYAPSFSGLNREHSFPKSWWGGTTTVSAYVDLNHLYPSEMKANTAKSNYPLGEVSTTQPVKFDNGCCKVGYPVSGQGGGAQYVFEPADEYKGDFARTYFYMATCYQDLHWSRLYMVSQNTYPTLNRWSVDLLLKWHRSDPVSEKETLRNEQVYRFQNNRNPFIDYPSLAEYIWGNRMGEAFNESSADLPGGDPELITPVQDMALEFGEIAEGQTATARLWFNGVYLTNPLSLRVYRNDAAMFSIPTSTIAANLVNSEEGYWLTVTYKPTALGQHTSRLLITGGGISGSRGIELRGSCLPKPNLSACTATAATDITDNSYVANWTYPQSEDVDYWIITRTIYANGSSRTEEVLAEEPGFTVTDFNASEYETYSVQSVRLGYRSPMSNVITVSHAGVSDITVDERPLAISVFEGALRFDTTVEHTNVRIFDTQGRQHRLLDTVSDGTIISLPYGVYLIVSDQQKRPIKVVVK